MQIISMRWHYKNKFRFIYISAGLLIYKFQLLCFIVRKHYYGLRVNTSRVYTIIFFCLPSFVVKQIVMHYLLHNFGNKTYSILTFRLTIATPKQISNSIQIAPDCSIFTRFTASRSWFVYQKVKISLIIFFWSKQR